MDKDPEPSEAPGTSPSTTDPPPVLGEDDDYIEPAPSKDKGKSTDKRQAVLARTAGGIVPVGPGLVVTSSLPDFDEDPGDWKGNGNGNPPAKSLAVFVVKFDTKHGNTVEWSYPQSVDVSGVEFSCLPSGAHNIHEDVIYFRNGPFYGIAAFGRAAGAIDQERGSRLRAVGLLAPDYIGLAAHIPFLRSRVRAALRNPGDYAELVPYYEATKSDWEPPRTKTRKAEETVGAESGESPAGSSSSSPPGSPTPPDDQIAPVARPTVPQILYELPAGQLATFVDYFGPQVFLIWKNVLAQKRILFFAPPPVLSLNHHVLAAIALAANFLPQGPEVPVDPVFYVNLNDIIEVSHRQSYCGCTTDSIILSKPQYYDLFLDHGVPVSGGPPIGGLGSNVAPAPKFFLTDLDKTRYRELRKIINETAKEGESKATGKKGKASASASSSAQQSGVSLLPEPTPNTADSAAYLIPDLGLRTTDDISQADSGFSEGRKTSESVGVERGRESAEGERERMLQADRIMAQEMERLTDTRIAKYFATLNTRLFRYLHAIAARPEPIVRAADYAHMGLHSRHDYHFLAEITDLYGIDVDIEPPGVALQEITAFASRVRHGCVRGVTMVATGCYRMGAHVVHGTRNAVGMCWGRGGNEGQLRI